MTLESDLSDLSDKSDVSDKMGASRYTPWVCCAAVWFGSGKKIATEVILAYFSGLFANPPPPRRARRRETEADVSAFHLEKKAERWWMVVSVAPAC